MRGFRWAVLLLVCALAVVLCGCSAESGVQEAGEPAASVSTPVEDDAVGGLSEDERKQVFYEMLEAEHRATAEADETYSPTDELQANADYSAQLREQYWAEIAAEWGVSVDDLGWISQEGITEQWPRPAQ